MSFAFRTSSLKERGIKLVPKKNEGFPGMLQELR